MLSPTATALRASAFAGSLAGVVGAVLYVATAVVLSLANGGFAREISDAVAVAVYVGLFGTFVGLAAGVAVGFPVLALLVLVRLNRPSIAATLGGVLAVVGAAMFAPVHTGFLWPALFGAVGAICGGVASYMCALTPPSSGQPSAAAHVER